MATLSKTTSQSESSFANRAPDSPAMLPLQMKLRMGRTGDAFEQEADQIAEQVAKAPDLKAIQRQTREEEEQPFQTQPAVDSISRLIRRQEVEEEEEPVQTETEQEEEEEPIQAQAQEEEKAPIQAQELEEEEPVQAQEEEEPIQAQEEQEREEDMVQARALTGAEVKDPNIEDRLAATQGSGFPLEGDIKQEMEEDFGRDFSSVRIHTDADAAELAQILRAQAFTHGNDIYFNQGKYDPVTTEGRRLLAHELTHVVQQRAGTQRVIRRANGEGGGEPSVSGDENAYSSNEGTINRRGGLRMQLPVLRVPRFKQPFTPTSDLVIRRGRAEGQRRETQQRAIWDRTARQGSGLSDALEQRLARAHKFGSESNPTHYLRIGRGRGDRSSFLVGTRTTILNRLLRPYWTPRGSPQLYEVDHQLEYQLNGEDDISNLWLLEREANGSSGRNIAREIQRRVNALLTSSRGAAVWRGQNPPDFGEAKRQFDEIKFRTVQFDLPVQKVGSPDPYSYTLAQIRDETRQLESVAPLSLAQVRRAGLIGSDTRLIIFNNPAGGRRYYLSLPNAEADQVPFTDRSFIPGFRPETAVITPEQNTIVTLRGRLWSNNPVLDFHGQRTEVEIAKFEGLEHTGRLNVAALRRQIENLFGSENVTVPGLSPIRLTDFSVASDGAIVITGKVITSIPLIDGADINIAVRGNDVRIEKTFYPGDIHIPGPIEVTDSSLTIAVGTESGFSISGQTNIEIPSVGTGLIQGEARTGRRGGASGGFSLRGQFDFDSELFNPARVGVSYNDGTFGVSGELGIPRGKVTGIRSATINVSYENETLNAAGDAELDVPGVERGTLSVTYGPEGWSIGGTFNLSNEIPGIRSGSVTATVRKVEGEEGYQLTASGTAVPDIPGIDSQLTVEYDNGALTIQATANYNRGLLSGEIRLGATNRALDDEGNPTGEPRDTFIVYGGGALTVRITPWLQGTVGVQFQPNGEMIVSGRIGLPSSIEVFRRFGVPERELFGIGFDIPIFAIPVGPKSIGLKATIRGGLRAYAGIGPGRLEQLELGIEYNPDRPEDTHVTGAGRLVIPAEAGLKLFVRATIGLDVAIGGVEGGLELAGGLGLGALAEAGVNVDWTPRSGLELNANLSARVQPKFIFTIDGLIRAWVLWYDKEWRWRLVDYEYGSNMTFGVRLPIRYREGEPFNISFDDVEVERPDIDVRSFLRGLIQDIRSRRG